MVASPGVVVRGQRLKTGDGRLKGEYQHADKVPNPSGRLKPAGTGR